MEKDVVRVFMDNLGKEFHENSVAHGFWPTRIETAGGSYNCEERTIVEVEKRNKGEMIALMHSELSEMLEGIRKPQADQHLSEFTSEEVEAADTIIRLLEYCFAFKLRIGEAIVAKHNYNVSRPFKHGKKF